MMTNLQLSNRKPKLALYIQQIVFLTSGLDAGAQICQLLFD